MTYFPPYIDDSGIHMPTYEDRLQDLLSAYREIFSQEAELSIAVPDYQLLSVIARALDDTSAIVLAAYNSRNPNYASGQALDLLLPQYGITREAGETDAEARARMKLALAADGQFSLYAMEAEIKKIPNVANILIRVNDTDQAVDGIPAHTVAALVLNGNAGLIADAIFRKKPPGIGTSGSLSRQVSDGRGGTTTIYFSRPQLLTIQFTLVVKAYDGFDLSAVQAKVLEATEAYIKDRLEIGESITIPQMYGLIYQAAGEYASTFAVTDLYATGAHGVEREKLIPAWNQKYVLSNYAPVIIEVET